MDFQTILQNHMSLSQIITDIMVVCMIIGAVDLILGNKFGLGDQFNEGFRSFASLAVSMSGIIVLIPIIGGAVGPFLSKVYEVTGIDPSVFVGSIIAADMGGYQLAVELSSTDYMASLGGMILGCTMGANIVFNIPVSLGIIKEEDRGAMAKGVLYGFITIPVAYFVSGLILGTPLSLLAVNLIPIILFSAIIAVLLWKVPALITKIFIIFGRIVAAAATISTVIAIAQHLTGITVVPGMGSITDAMGIVVTCVFVLPGAYVFVTLLSRILRKPFAAFGRLLHINETSTLGLLTTLANAVPTFSLIKDMDERGKVINFAFLVSASFALGDHLAFCSAMNAEIVPAMLIGKLSGAVAAVVVAHFMTRSKNTES